MTQMESVQIRFPSEELKRIDSYVKRGEYHSRSEFIRDAVRKAEMIQALKDILKIMEKEGITEEDLHKGGKAIREKIFSEMFGEIE